MSLWTSPGPRAPRASSTNHRNCSESGMGSSSSPLRTCTWTESAVSASSRVTMHHSRNQRPLHSSWLCPILLTCPSSASPRKKKTMPWTPRASPAAYLFPSPPREILPGAAYVSLGFSPSLSLPSPTTTTPRYCSGPSPQGSINFQIQLKCFFVFIPHGHGFHKFPASASQPP